MRQWLQNAIQQIGEASPQRYRDKSVLQRAGYNTAKRGVTRSVSRQSADAFDAAFARAPRPFSAIGRGYDRGVGRRSRWVSEGAGASPGQIARGVSNAARRFVRDFNQGGHGVTAVYVPATRKKYGHAKIDTPHGEVTTAVQVLRASNGETAALMHLKGPKGVERLYHDGLHADALHKVSGYKSPRLSESRTYPDHKDPKRSGATTSHGENIGWRYSKGLRYGDRVEVAHGSGTLSGKTGVVAPLHPKHASSLHNSGHKMSDFHGVVFDNGEYDVVHKVRLRRVSEDKKPGVIDRINARGLANGWHAQQIAARAKHAGMSQADYWRHQTAGASAFSVPAKAVKLKGRMVHYRFADGSTTAHPLPDKVRESADRKAVVSGERPHSTYRGTHLWYNRKAQSGLRWHALTDSGRVVADTLAGLRRAVRDGSRKVGESAFKGFSVTGYHGKTAQRQSMPRFGVYSSDKVGPGHRNVFTAHDLAADAVASYDKMRASGHDGAYIVDRNARRFARKYQRPSESVSEAKRLPKDHEVIQHMDGESGAPTVSMTYGHAKSVAGRGDQEHNVNALIRGGHVKVHMNQAEIAKHLKSYGAWDHNELKDHGKNLQRLVWCAGCDIAERPHDYT